ncbi:hypothetical protein J1614_002355 [Plenodomus biglobosus]|nr:hypothetical protein J1614_002355 [Plenodomus biglobosus]
MSLATRASSWGTTLTGVRSLHWDMRPPYQPHVPSTFCWATAVHGPTISGHPYSTFAHEIVPFRGAT